jgi:hypothetical protein
VWLRNRASQLLGSLKGMLSLWVISSLPRRVMIVSKCP